MGPFTRVHGLNESDHAFFLWAFAHAADAVSHGHNPMFADLMNVPLGVNLMANTSVLAFAVPLVPVTLLFGPQISYLLLLTFAFAATATAWYWLLSRHVVAHRLAALAGAAVCGFAPGMISQGNGHPNLVAQFLVPVIIWRVLKLREPGRKRILVNGLVLGLLMVWQAFINEEILFLTAVGLAIFCAAYAISRRDEARLWWRPMLAGLSVAAVVTVAVLAYPLAFQFLGPQSYRGVPHGIGRFGADLASYPTFGRGSIAGDPATVGRLAPNPTEENTFYGWPLVLALLAGGVWLWRRPLVRALSVTGLVLVALSLGPLVRSYGRTTGLPGPWRILAPLPLFDTVVPVRIALFVIPVVGLLTALVAAELLTATARGTLARRFAYAGMGLALLPLLPVPLTVTERPVPTFFADGTWKDYVPAGRTLVTLPVTGPSDTDGMRWAAATGLGFHLAGGYFLGPGRAPGDASLFTAPQRPTTSIFVTIGRTGETPVLGATERAAAVEDLRYWRASVVVLGPLNRYPDPADRRRKEAAMLAAGTKLFGEPSYLGGLWVWDVRPLTD